MENVVHFTRQRGEGPEVNGHQSHDEQARITEVYVNQINLRPGGRDRYLDA